MEMSAVTITATKSILPLLSTHRPVSTVRSDPFRRTCAPRALVRRKRRTHRRSLEDGEDSDDLLSGDGDDGPFGGGGSGGGRGWNFGGDEGANWEDRHSNGDDPAFSFVYEIVLGVALWDCLIFSAKKLGRILRRADLRPEFV